MEILAVWLLLAALSIVLFRHAKSSSPPPPKKKKKKRNYDKMTEKQLVAALKKDHGVDTRLSGLKATKLILLKLLDEK